MLDRDSPLLPGAAPPKPGAKRSFAEERLREAVITCEIMPGTKVSEARLVSLYGLNRAGVRASLMRLEAGGLVEAMPRHGWRVRPVSGAYIGEVVAARRTLEPAVATVRHDPAQLDRLDNLAQVAAVLAERQEPGARSSLRSYEREFLGILAAPLGDLRRRWLHEAWDHSERLIRFFEAGSDRRAGAPGRAPLVAALRAADPAAVTAALGQALYSFEAFVLAALTEQDVEIRRTPPKTTPATDTAAAGRGLAPAPSPRNTNPRRGSLEWTGDKD
ncbi:GntR family transcriptional regulator [Acuticoccus sp. I52.16.1]|uniref:GntR family transcriptional regulator n=1 Tax=Acuticoccus sp. I52.16.1 TaxID=2928472 RepID=UPI001FD3D44C|nr:GntR family transcriptional regulator [Acuticoccus sp. I52.16.1]UOM37159.1 GntR family transcriptional regulator [Acuticoccus sp. I52.16.1]